MSNLTIEIKGGKRGYENLGQITIPDAPDAKVAATFDGKVAVITVTPGDQKLTSGKAK